MLPVEAVYCVSAAGFRDDPCPAGKWLCTGQGMVWAGVFHLQLPWRVELFCLTTAKCTFHWIGGRVGWAKQGSLALIHTKSLMDFFLLQSLLILHFLSTNIWVNQIHVKTIPRSHAKESLEIISAHKSTRACNQETVTSCAREATWCWVSDLYLDMHRIRELFKLENPLRPSSPTTDPAPPSPPWATPLSTTFTGYLNNSRCGDSSIACSNAWSPFQRRHFPWYPTKTSPGHNLRPFPLAVSLVTWKKWPLSTWVQPALRGVVESDKVPLMLFFSILNNLCR